MHKRNPSIVELQMGFSLATLLFLSNFLPYMSKYGIFSFESFCLICRDDVSEAWHCREDWPAAGAGIACTWSTGNTVRMAWNTIPAVWPVKQTESNSRSKTPLNRCVWRWTKLWPNLLIKFPTSHTISQLHPLNIPQAFPLLYSRSPRAVWRSSVHDMTVM